jgi:hypothetical protein
VANTRAYSPISRYETLIEYTVTILVGAAISLITPALVFFMWGT